MSESKELRVPCRQYFRPNGDNQKGWLIIPNEYRPQRDLILRVIENEGIQFTLEVMPFNVVSICMDDGTFDYIARLVVPGKVNETVLALIDEFDVNRYREHYRMHAES
jgi:hypothetical protein